MCIMCIRCLIRGCGAGACIIIGQEWGVPIASEGFCGLAFMSKCTNSYSLTIHTNNINDVAILSTLYHFCMQNRKQDKQLPSVIAIGHGYS